MRFDFGRPERERVMTDTDKDGFPGPIDCKPWNPNKQGLRDWWAKMKERRAMKKAGMEEVEVEKPEYEQTSDTKYEYKVQAPAKKKASERLREAGEKYRSWRGQQRERQLEKLQYQSKKAEMQSKIQQSKSQVAQSRLKLQRERVSLMAQRQKATPSITSMSPMGSSKGALKASVWTPSPTLANMERVRKPVKIHKPKKKRRKKRYYYK